MDIRILRCDGLDICDFYINDITYTDHEFLDNVRDDKNWDKIEEVAKNIGFTLVQSLVAIATALITEIIRKRLEDILYGKNK